MKNVRKIKVPGSDNLKTPNLAKSEEVPDTTMMSFSEFSSYWKRTSKNPPSENIILSLRVWCEKRNEWLKEKQTSNTAEGQRKYDLHKDRYIHEKNSLQIWKELLWEFIGGNSSLGATGRPNFLGTSGTGGG